MKNVFLSAVTALLLFSCQNDQTESGDSNVSATAHRGCATQEVLEAQFIADP